MREPELAQEPPDGIQMAADTGRIEQGSSQFGHGDVAVLANDPGEQGTVMVRFSFALRTALRCRARRSGTPDRKPLSRARRWRQLQPQGRRAPAQPFPDQSLKPRS